ncbi:MFS general substrate transporter [Panus rudis PR-1116 ss-1]|nr:MFS general substrate transporter [Panus rudis PR-1116 ss-1]
MSNNPVMSESKVSSLSAEEKAIGTSVSESPPAETPKPAPLTYPEGGFVAWLTIAGAFLIQFSTFGYTNAFAVYQDFYVRDFLNNSNASAISWIGSVQLLLVLSTGFIVGALFDRGYLQVFFAVILISGGSLKHDSHYLMLGGSLLVGFCLFMLSLAKPHQYYQVFLSQGLGMGLALGMTYVPSLGIVAHHFNRRRPVAMGVVAAGSSLGATLHPIMLNNLFNKIGFANGVRASAGLNLGLMLIACAIMRTRLPPKQGVSILGVFKNARSFIKDGAYVCAVGGVILSITGFYYPIFYLQLNSISHGLDTTFAFYSIVILNGVSIIGRVLPPFFAARSGVMNLLIICMYSCSVLIFAMIGVKTVGSTVAFSIIFGFFGGGLVTLLAPVYASLARDFSEIGARMGFAYTFLGLGGLVGTPVSGALLGSKEIWWKPAVWAGTCVAVGSTLMLLGRTIQARRKGKWNV